MSEIDWGALFPKPQRDDEREAKRWRGALFWGLSVPLSWKDHQQGFYDHIKAPKSVTFPICFCCQHIIWDWPHFEEEVPDNAICDTCAEDETNL